MLLLAAMATVAGTGGAFSAWALLKLIALTTNLMWYASWSFDHAAIAGRSALMILLIPIIGGLVVGLMARFGSDKIRGHGIPEAIETILFGDSKLSLKVALLKPLSSAVSIGSGGPFGAEGPIIMTGGAIGSLFAQLFRLTAAERKTLLVAGATAGMTGIFGTPFASIMLAVELLLFDNDPRALQGYTLISPFDSTKIVPPRHAGPSRAYVGDRTARRPVRVPPRKRPPACAPARSAETRHVFGPGPASAGGFRSSPGTASWSGTSSSTTPSSFPTTT